MTELHRFTSEEPPFGRGTFFAASPSSAKELAAKVEADGEVGRRLYVIDKDIEPW